MHELTLHGKYWIFQYSHNFFQEHFLNCPPQVFSENALDLLSIQQEWFSRFPDKNVF